MNISRLITIPALGIVLCACGAQGTNKQGLTENADGILAADTPVVETPKKLTLLFAGDLMQHGVQFKAARQPDGTYNYDECFRYVHDDIESVDVAIANFETTVAGGTPTTYPQFNSPDEYLFACRDAGFDILLTANNHSVDKGAKGICRTIDMMDSIGVPHIGTYKDQAERDREYPYILEKNGFRIALLVYTYSTNGIPVPKPCIVNPISRDLIAKDIKKAKAQDVDCIIAFMHWGIEHALQPNKEQRDLADWMFQQGVDHIIGGHPHVVEPIEVRQGTDGARHLLVYSLGNYISNMTKPNNDGGLMVKMELTKDGGNTTMTDCSYALTWVSRPAVSNNKNYRVYPASVPESMLNATERQLFNKTITTERQLFEKYNKGISEYQVEWKQ